MTQGISLQTILDLFLAYLLILFMIIPVTARLAACCSIVLRSEARPGVGEEH